MDEHDAVTAQSPVSTEEPVTVVVRRRPRPGCEAQLEAWLRDVIAVMGRFPGYQGSTVLRPSGDGGLEHVLVFRFASFADFQRWQASDERTAWLARAEPLTEAHEVRTQEGLEPFFDLPAHRAAPPPRWKMAVLTWVGLYPLVVGVGLATRPWLGEVPFALAVAPQTAITVALMAWLVMPVLTRRASGWLYP